MLKFENESMLLDQTRVGGGGLRFFGRPQQVISAYSAAQHKVNLDGDILSP